jgi:hypothetical protein
MADVYILVTSPLCTDSSGVPGKDIAVTISWVNRSYSSSGSSGILSGVAAAI